MGSSCWSRIIGSMSQHLDYRNMLAGILAGVTATLVLHPLELVKVRMQVDEGGQTKLNGKGGSKMAPARPQYSGVISALGSIYKSEGGVRSLYQGVTPNIWGSGASWGLYFLFYNALKSVMASQFLDGGATPKLPTHIHLISAFVAGASTSMITNPIWMMKTRLCLQYKSDRFEKSTMDPSGKSAKLIHYNGMVDGLYKVIKHEGFMALYKGISFGILGTLHGVIQFGVYEQLKQNHQQLFGGSTLL